MKYFMAVFALSVFAFMSIGNADAIPPFSSQQVYDFSNTIVVGKVVSVNSTFSSTHNLYQIQVEKFLKNQNDSDTLYAVAQNTEISKLGNHVFDVGDKAVFFLTKTSFGYDTESNMFYIHPESFLITHELEECNAFEKEIPPDHWFLGGTGPMPERFQGDGVDARRFRMGIPVIVTYDVSNLSNATREFDVGANLTYGDSKSVRLDKHVVLEPCTLYETLQWSFTPRESGNYFLEINDPSRKLQTGSGFIIESKNQHTIESIDGKLFFVSKTFGTKQSDDILSFFNVNFTYPSFPEIPNPGGFVSSTITFPDGTKKSVSLGYGQNISPVLAEQNGIYAGIMRDYDGLHLLTSADLKKLSPLKQFNLGASFDEIECKENLVLVEKYDGSPACVREDTKEKLAQRGWLKTEFSINSTGSNNSILGKSMKISLNDFKDMSFESQTVDSLFSRFGQPNKDIGSGIHIYVYMLNDSTQVWIGYTDHILYVAHMDSDGNSLEQLYAEK